MPRVTPRRQDDHHCPSTPCMVSLSLCSDIWRENTIKDTLNEEDTLSLMDKMICPNVLEVPPYIYVRVWNRYLLRSS